MIDKTVYVGRKPVMAYVMAVITGFKNDNKTVILRARGRSILTAVDAAEVTRNNYLPDITCNVTIGTEQLEGEDGKPRNVSTIEITLSQSHEAKEPRGREQTTEAE